MKLGVFSISLPVKDIEASRIFCEKFGFTTFGGDPTQNWRILKTAAKSPGCSKGCLTKIC